MVALDAANVSLGETLATKEEAIRRVGALLTSSGYTDPDYAESMLGREKVANTYLGSGIAIPHGLLKDRDLIHRTGIAVVQVPGGVEWNPGETVRLVIGIAAASDEHLDVLANLTRILADEEEIGRLATVTDPALVISRLGQAGAAPAAPGPTEPPPDLDGYVTVDVPVPGSSGLHARPAALFVDVAKGFASDVRVRHGERVANGKSLGSLLTLGAEAGANLTILARGADQEAALRALREAVEAGLGEGDEPADAPVPGGLSWEPAGPGTPVLGVSAAGGIAIGPLWHLKRRRLVVGRTARDPVLEERRLRGAIESARAGLRELHDAVRAKSGAGRAAIFRAHEAFLDDPDLTAATLERIRAGSSAGWAWQQTFEEQAAALGRVDDPLVASRAIDLGDVGERVLGFLAEVDDDAPHLPDHPVILVAEDLSPSDTAAIDPARVVGFCTAAGGPTSHTAIIARALGIPAVVGAGRAALTQPEGVTAVLDGFSGTLWVGLGPGDLGAAERAREDLTAARAVEHQTRYEPAITTDGHRVQVVANIAAPAEAAAAVEAGAEGVGLLRTEFLFLGRDTPPSEDEQYDAMAEMVTALGGLPLVVRTLDIGGDKQAPWLELPAEDNPFLGVRGIRLCLARPDLFLPQLRAIYRASLLGPVEIMFPMVARLEDLEGALEYAEKARVEVGAAPVDIGVMIEVPAAVAMAPELARRVQFFSVGTNDLTQYVLAMDRGHPTLARQADALHPAVLRMIKALVDAADAAGIWVGVCGGMAVEPEGALILTGLGVTELSVSIPSVAAVKARLRTVSREAAEQLARRALACATATEVRDLALP